MTPLQLSFLIHCRITLSQFPNIECSPQQEVVESFIEDEIIFPANNPDNLIYGLTEKGNVFLDMVLSTPYPTKVFVNPLSGKVLNPINKE